MAEYRIRRAVEADIPAIMRIRNSVRENVLSDPTRVTYAMCVDHLDRVGRGWVCEAGTETVGFSYAASADASIWALFVLPDHEGRGIGSALLKAAVEWLFSTGNDLIRLSTTAGTRADTFYAAAGWIRQPGDTDEVCFTLMRTVSSA